VSVNGADTPLVDLVERARAMQRAFCDLSMEIIDEVEAPGRLVIVFWPWGSSTLRTGVRARCTRSPFLTSRGPQTWRRCNSTTLRSLPANLDREQPGRKCVAFDLVLAA
jgi:hypothetical protein